MKKYIAIISPNDAYRDSLLAFLQSNDLCDAAHSVMQPLLEFVPAALRLSPEYFIKGNQEFPAPFQIKDHHIRHFYSKISRGVYAVQRYNGKILKNSLETLRFFEEVVGADAYGKDWLVNFAFEVLDDFPEGIFALTDLTVPQAKTMKTNLKNDLVVLYITPNKEQEGIPEFADIVLESHDSKGNQKQVQTQLASKIRKTWKEKE